MLKERHKKQLTQFFNDIGFKTPAQSAQHADFLEKTRELDVLAENIIYDYIKYEKHKENPDNKSCQFYYPPELRKILEEPKTREEVSYAPNLDELKSHILEQLDKFKQKIKDVFGENGMSYYVKHGETKRMEKYTLKSWPGNTLKNHLGAPSLMCDQSGKSTRTDLIGIDHILRTGEKPDPDFCLSWENDDSDPVYKREYYYHLTFEAS